jgi:hypothetical protein
MDLQPSQAVGSVGPVVEKLRIKSEAARILSDRANHDAVLSPREAVEVLIPDSRAELSPAQSVERKLTSMLRGATIPVSHIRLARLCGKR